MFENNSKNQKYQAQIFSYNQFIIKTFYNKIIHVKNAKLINDNFKI